MKKLTKIFISIVYRPMFSFQMKKCSSSVSTNQYMFNCYAVTTKSFQFGNGHISIWLQESGIGEMGEHRRRRFFLIKNARLRSFSNQLIGLDRSSFCCLSSLFPALSAGSRVSNLLLPVEKQQRRGVNWNEKYCHHCHPSPSVCFSFENNCCWIKRNFTLSWKKVTWESLLNNIWYYLDWLLEMSITISILLSIMSSICRFASCPAQIHQ